MTPKPRKAPPKKPPKKPAPIDSPKRPEGRPRSFSSVEDMQTRINRYFGSITIDEMVTESLLVGFEDEEKKKPIYESRPVFDNNGEPRMRTRYFEHPSVIAMCLYMGISRDTLSEYAKRPEFSDAIKSARGKIERYLEDLLAKEQGQVTGIIFNLKNNFGWVDKQEVESTNVNFNHEMSVEEANEYLKSQGVKV